MMEFLEETWRSCQSIKQTKKRGKVSFWLIKSNTRCLTYYLIIWKVTVTVSQHEQHQYLDTSGLIINFIVYRHACPALTCQNIFCEKGPLTHQPSDIKKRDYSMNSAQGWTGLYCPIWSHLITILLCHKWCQYVCDPPCCSEWGRGRPPVGSRRGSQPNMRSVSDPSDPCAIHTASEEVGCAKASVPPSTTTVAPIITRDV